MGVQGPENEETECCYSDGKSEISPWILVVEDSEGKFAPKNGQIVLVGSAIGVFEKVA